MSSPLLEANNLTIQYYTSSGPITAVSDASFAIDEGEYFGLVGESGCGKSTIAKSLLGGLDENGEITSGSIRYRGNEIQDMTEQELSEEIRWKEISYVPQGSMNSLDPLMRVHNQALKLADIHTNLTETEALDRLRELFDIVGISPERISDYPSQFSGGMRQRATIALGLFLKPSLVIADEPTTALDVIMQDQVFKYLDDIQEEFQTSMLLITHDISLVFESCNSMAVMHSGQICETGTVNDIYYTPRHPYTILLQRSFPDVENPNRELIPIEGEPPQMGDDVNFCTFSDRCPWEIDECQQAAPAPESTNTQSNMHFASCFRHQDMASLVKEYGIELESQEQEAD